MQRRTFAAEHADDPQPALDWGTGVVLVCGLAQSAFVRASVSVRLCVCVGLCVRGCGYVRAMVCVSEGTRKRGWGGVLGAATSARRGTTIVTLGAGAGTRGFGGSGRPAGWVPCAL